MHDLVDEMDGADKALFKCVRTSKYRHVYGSATRRDHCYDNINITKNAHDGNFCAVNLKFLAIVTESCGGGNFIVIPLDKVGRIDVHSGRVTGHKGQIYDIKWNPFDDNVIASCSEDTTIKLWSIPDKGLLSRHLDQPIVDLRGHKRRVSFIEWHPTAENILLSVGLDHLVIVWNVGRAEKVRVINCHKDVIHSLSFNRDGSLFATTSKDKKLRIIDPRSCKVINEGICHQGPKAAKAVFLGDSQRLFTVGFSQRSDREWAIWSQHDLSKELRIESIDSSSGVLFPYYDHDTRIVFVAGKGDGNIRFYETTDEPPYCHYISQFMSGLPQRGFGVMPKRGCDVYKCEIFRLYKLHASKSMCEPISMIVPRKSEQFQADIFPDTAAPTPALTAEQWLNGQNRNPILLNLKTGVGTKTNKPIYTKPQADSGQRQTTADFNNERKLEFIAQANQIDYREKLDLDSKNDAHRNGSNTKNENCDHENIVKTLVKKSYDKPKSNEYSRHFQATKHHFESKSDSGDHRYPMQEMQASFQFLCKTSNNSSRTKLPWIKDDDDRAKEQPLTPQCAISISLNSLPNGKFNLSHDDSDDSANTTDDSITDDMFQNINCQNSHSNDSVNSQFTSASSKSPTSDALSDKPDIYDLIDAKLDVIPKNEREVWAAFHELKALVLNARKHLEDREKKIDQLEKIIYQNDYKLFNF